MSKYDPEMPATKTYRRKSLWIHKICSQWDASALPFPSQSKRSWNVKFKTLNATLKVVF